MGQVTLNGNSLGIEGLIRLCRGDRQFAVDERCWPRLEQARAVVDKVIARGEPVYGLTTGLGAKVTEVLSPEQLTDFSYATLRGRAHAVTAPVFHGRPLGTVHIIFRFPVSPAGATAAVKNRRTGRIKALFPGHSILLTLHRYSA